MNKVRLILLVSMMALTPQINMYAVDDKHDIITKNEPRQTNTYPKDKLFAEAYYDAALKGELQTEKMEPFLLSSLKQIGKKIVGDAHGGIYEDINGGIWIVKKGQSPVDEYLGSKVMDLLIGPLSPEVKLFIDEPFYTASKLIPGFLMKSDVMKDPNHKPIVGELKLLLAMDLMGLEDRTLRNLGYVDMDDRLEAARVDFDASFVNFSPLLEVEASTDLKALESISGLPDEMIYYVLGDAFNNLWEAGIPVSYRKYKNLGSTLIARKNELKNFLSEIREMETFFDKTQNNPSLLNTKNKWGTPLHLAIKLGKLDLVPFLLEQGLDVNAKNEWGETPLHLAARYDYLGIISLFVDKGAAVDLKNTHGETPLHLAVELGHMNIVLLLLDKGADVNATTDRWGQTPLELAKENEYKDIARLLEEKMKNKGQ